MSTDSEASAKGGQAMTVAMLRKTFARVLHRSAVDADDDFFELGGDSIMAVELAVEIEQDTGISLPTTLLFDASTATALAHLLDEKNGTSPSKIVRLKAGDDGPPIFIMPGVAGSPVELRPLANLIESDGPIYGLRAPGLVASEAPLDRIEAMAAHYLPLIQSVQPYGPYCLAGYSMGGLTALEIARLLLRQGEKVALLALLNTVVHPRTLPLATRARMWYRRARHHIGPPRTLRPGELPTRIADPIPGLMAGLHAPASTRDDDLEQDRQTVPEATSNVIASGVAAVTQYRRKPYPGTITLIQTVEDRNSPAQIDILWGGLAERLALRRVSGDHLDIVGHHVASLAAALSQCVREAAGSAETG